MARMPNLLVVILAVVGFFSISASNVVYTVTLVSCDHDTTCPQGNILALSVTFALNGVLSPNLTLNVNDRLEFDLASTFTNHLLTICQNSVIPSFCHQASGADVLGAQLNTAGTTTSVTFTTAGTYYYGCNFHPGMGAIINVIQTAEGNGD